MSTVYTGDPTTITTPLSATITNATNATPIVCTTSANHLYATGDRVLVSGVLGNTAANSSTIGQEWVITVLSPTTFSLNGSSGNGAYTGGGLAINHSFTPQFTIPSDADPFNVASVNVALETLADRSQAIAGFLTCPRVWTMSVTQSDTPPATTWTAQAFNTTTRYDLPLIMARGGDIVETNISCCFTNTPGSAGSPEAFIVRLIDSQNGGGFAQIPGSVKGQDLQGFTVAGNSGNILASPMSINGIRVITTAGTYQVSVNALTGHAGDTLAFTDGISATIRVWRTGV